MKQDANHIMRLWRAMWPEAIPVRDYPRALALLDAAAVSSAPSHAPPVPRATGPTPKPPHPRKRSRTAYRPTEETIQRVREALESGPATSLELADVTGLSKTTVRYVLNEIGVVDRKIKASHSVGGGKPTYVWRLKGTRAPPAGASTATGGPA